MVNYSDDWGQYLDAAVFATNTSVQSTTKYTPFRMMFGRDPRFPLEAEKEGESIRFEDTVESIKKSSVENVVEVVAEKQKAIFETVDKNIKEAQKKQSEQYRKRKGLISHHFKKGDHVLRRNMKQKTRKGSKNEDRWLGPYKILEIVKTTCLLQNRTGKELKSRVNINQLKPYLHQTLPVEKCASTGNTSKSMIHEGACAAESLLSISHSVQSNAAVVSAEDDTIADKGQIEKFMVRIHNFSL